VRTDFSNCSRSGCWMGWIWIRGRVGWWRIIKQRPTAHSL